MLDFSVYLLYRLATAIVGLVPLPLLFRVGEVLGLLNWLLLGRYRRLAKRNLAIAFGDEKTPAELSRLTRQHFQRLGANLLCSVKIGTMPVADVVRCVTLENADYMHAELRAGRGVALAISHLGSWEAFAQIFAAHFGYARLSTIFQPLGNPYIDADVRRKRGRAGIELCDRREGFQKPIEVLRGGGVVGLLCDQHAGDQGLWTPFFGRLASTTPLPGLLAKRTGAAVMTSVTYTEGPGRWRLTFNPLLNAPGDSVDRITAKVNAEVAEQIRRAPEDWFWVHNRWKTPKPNFLLSKYKRGVYVPDGESLSQPFRILIRGTNWLGDSVISSEAVRAIKRGRPDAHVTIAAPAKLAAVWKLIPEVDEVLPLEAKSLFATVSLLRKQRPFDVGILFPNSLRSALELWLAKVPRRVGFRGHHRAWLLNQIVPERVVRGPIEHQVHRYLHLAETLGAEVEKLEKLTTGKRIPPAATASARSRLALCPGAEYGPAKRWLPERFAEVASNVAAERNVQWILFGTAADAASGSNVAQTLGENGLNRIGQTSLDDLIRELRECRLLLTNDTGTMHLATLLGVPVVAVFGSTEPRLTGPLSAGHIVIRHHVECSPCFLRECPIDFRCMHAVTTEEVTRAVLSLLDSEQKLPR